MAHLITESLALPGLGWLIAAIVAAGLVRGFAGFGSGMIIMAAASSVLSPFAALAFLVVVEFWGPLPNLRAAWRDGDLNEAKFLLLGVAVGMPLGLWTLSFVAPEVFGWGVSVAILFLLAALMSGWRYTGPMGPRMIAGVGTFGGFLGGLAGIPGPPVILLYMASAKAIAVIRANFLLYLLGIDVMMLGIFWVFDLLDAQAVIIGLVLVPLYMVANVAGAWLFDPKAERLFRAVAYIVIAASAILGLPIWEMGHAPQ
ncbi:membrane protein [Tateyamaria omphalii]|uniref:sulfite exporter TauE/SafE family protein n=1 Tax=Tateyamaria omphalii TaxID=299262 RepID=UPI0016755607|nr:sulfite exporter TauE/SafE family protein [Tateyamaria omphalii]GGX48373.1 membrane protein [Tateyamaria omphalii]